MLRIRLFIGKVEMVSSIYQPRNGAKFSWVSSGFGDINVTLFPVVIQRRCQICGEGGKAPPVNPALTSVPSAK